MISNFEFLTVVVVDDDSPSSHNHVSKAAKLQKEKENSLNGRLISSRPLKVVLLVKLELFPTVWFCSFLSTAPGPVAFYKCTLSVGRMSYPPLNIFGSINDGMEPLRIISTR